MIDYSTNYDDKKRRHLSTPQKYDWLLDQLWRQKASSLVYTSKILLITRPIMTTKSVVTCLHLKNMIDYSINYHDKSVDCHLSAPQKYDWLLDQLSRQERRSPLINTPQKHDYSINHHDKKRRHLSTPQKHDWLLDQLSRQERRSSLINSPHLARLFFSSVRCRSSTVSVLWHFVWREARSAGAGFVLSSCGHF